MSSKSRNPKNFALRLFSSSALLLIGVHFFAAVAYSQKPECKTRPDDKEKDNDRLIEWVKIVSPEDYTMFKPLDVAKPEGTDPVPIKISFRTGEGCVLVESKIKLVDIFSGNEVQENVKLHGNAPTFTFTADVKRGYQNKYVRLSITYGGERLDGPGHVDFLVYSRKPGVGDNGIYVVTPKVYDERSLIEKLLDLETTLAGKLFIDPSKVAGAIGSLQGATQNVSTLNVQATTLPLPGLTETIASGSQANTNITSGTSTTPTGTTTNSNAANTTGTTSNTNTNTSMPVVTPVAPPLAAQTVAFNPALAFGQAASNLLAEQMQLSYEIINIRTLLERAISDNVDLTNGNSRDQAVLGFRVSIDSQEMYKDAIAEVRVKVKNLIPRPAPNIVSLIPQEKTYNVATVTKNSKQFGFGGVVQIISFGVSASNTKDTFYLVKDNDTVALEGTPFDDDTDATSFSWQFRPVLGQKIVQPGTRNVLALLSLPPGDLENGEDTSYVAEIEVKTRWRKYDAKRRTVGRQIGDESSQFFEAVVIPTYKSEFTAPKIESVRWEDARNGQALVVVKGNKFVRGTGILAGTTAINSPATGLFISDEQNIRFTIPIAQLGVLSDIYIAGRYGSPIELVNYSDEKITLTDEIKIESVNSSTSKVTIIIKCPYGCDERFLRQQRPLAIIGNQVFGTTGSPIEQKGIKVKGKETYSDLTLSFQAPTQLLSDVKKITVKYPFLDSDRYSFEREIMVDESFSASGVVLLSTSENSFQLGIRGTKLLGVTTVRVGKHTFKIASDEDPIGRLEGLSESLLYLNLDMSPRELATVSNIIVTKGDKTIILPIDLKAVPAAKPDFHEPFPTINQGDSKSIEFKGANFSSLQDIKFEGKTLRFTAKNDGATLEIELTTEVTGLKGVKKLNYTLKDGKSGSVEVTVK